MVEFENWIEDIIDTIMEYQTAKHIGNDECEIDFENSKEMKERLSTLLKSFYESMNDRPY